ncbi:MAG: hypothetical protein ABI741_06505 [Ferruginibacter sp.]
MKKMILVFILLSGVGKYLFAQQFSSNELVTIKPSQVIIENYSTINLSKEIIEDPMANRFDQGNPYTYLQIVTDAKLNRYHILFQTGFTGKILFLSYSNNLSALFNKKTKPMFLFTRCLKEINNHISSIEVMDAVVECILARLNYCYDN